MSKPWLYALCLALCLASAISCGQCGEEIVAEVAVARGDVQRDRKAYPGQFSQVMVADALHLGDGLRTGPRSEAELKLFPDGVARIEPSTLVRFMSERPAGGIERLTIEEGVIELDATAIDLEIDTGHGVARIKQGSRIRVRAPGADDVQLDVLVGRVAIERPGQATQQVEAGETVPLASPRGAEPTAPAAAKAAPESPATAATPEPTPTEDETATELVKTVDFTLERLENAVVHAPALPLDIALPLPACPEPATIEVSAGAARRSLRAEAGAGVVAMRMKAGLHKLRVRCGAETRELTLRLVRDPATQELPRTAPLVDVAADGRRYTVRYENLLPSVVFAWPNAESAPRYTLLVKRAQGRELRFESDRPERQIRSGELGEGEYAFLFTTANGKRSPESSLRISFDNTARSAYLSAPADGSPTASSIRVVGGALVRSDVSVMGLALPLDAQGRFAADIAHAPTVNAIAVRVSHPATGVHYYVRRLL